MPHWRACSQLPVRLAPLPLCSLSLALLHFRLVRYRLLRTLDTAGAVLNHISALLCRANAACRRSDASLHRSLLLVAFGAPGHRPDGPL